MLYSGRVVDAVMRGDTAREKGRSAYLPSILSREAVVPQITIAPRGTRPFPSLYRREFTRRFAKRLGQRGLISSQQG